MALLLAACAAGTIIHNDTGCTASPSHTNLTAASIAACCTTCSTNATCASWTFFPAGHHLGRRDVGTCLVSADPQTVKTAATIGLTCGCRYAGCTPAPVQCDPIPRPRKPVLQPLPPGQTFRPHFVTLLIDDLGRDDTSLYGNAGITFTPNIQALADDGILLDRHHTYIWCSPTRRAFLSGRYPTHITGTQAPQCSNYLPLQFTILSEKLAAADYESGFIGKGHLGVHTVDHLPANRGFSSHVGYLGGGESYKWGGTYGASGDPAKVKFHDMWSNDRPADDLVDTIDYSTTFYSALAVDRIQARNVSRPFWLHVAYQAVHGGTWREEVPGTDAIPANSSGGLYPHFQAGNYGSVTHALDDGVGNITAELKRQGMWEQTLMLFTSDNGGDCGLPDQPGVGGQPGSASNYPLLGRKCTAFEGGTRVAAFLVGGMVPVSRRGTVSDQLMYITDWYPTFCNLAGVDPSDAWVDPSTQAVHDIDGVDVWPALSSGADGISAPVREWLPTSERSLLWNDGAGHMWKLITSGRWETTGSFDYSDEYQANRFHKNGSQYMDPFNACLPNTTGTTLRGTVGVPASCSVCSNSTPCVFDVLADPLETTNVASANASLVALLAAKLAVFNNPYIPSVLTPANLACYNCTLSDSKGIGKWGSFWGPCCIAKTPSP
jgi:arylsulfatase B